MPINNKKRLKDHVSNPIIRNVGLVMITLVLFQGFRSQFYDVYTIEGNDMSPSLHPNEIVFIQKTKQNLQQGDLVLYRLRSTDSAGSRYKCLQRLIGLPGDTIEISEKIVSVNSNELSEGYTKFNYILEPDSMGIDSIILSKFNITEGGSVSKFNKFSYTLSAPQLDSLKNLVSFKTVLLRTEKDDIKDPETFPDADEYTWNKDHFGKLYIPKYGDILTLDTSSIKLYFNLIHEYEKNTIKVEDTVIVINGQASKSYKVKYNYYFFLGDNRDNCLDSRHWGYIPQKDIIGKLVYTVK